MWYICILNCSLLQKKNDVSMNDLGFTKSSVLFNFFFFAESLSDTHCIMAIWRKKLIAKQINTLRWDSIGAWSKRIWIWHFVLYSRGGLLSTIVRQRCGDSTETGHQGALASVDIFKKMAARLSGWLNSTLQAVKIGCHWLATGPGGSLQSKGPGLDPVSQGPTLSRCMVQGFRIDVCRGI